MSKIKFSDDSYCNTVYTFPTGFGEEVSITEFADYSGAILPANFDGILNAEGVKHLTKVMKIIRANHKSNEALKAYNV